MKRFFLIFFSVILVLFLGIAAFLLHNMRDLHSGYKLDVTILPETPTTPIKVGLAKRTITPMVEDTWTDANHNARYEPDKGDQFVDKNGNGRFDAYWLAGFQNNRPATGVHDDIWARAIVWDDGNIQVALVVIDAIGFFHDDVIDVRKAVEEKGMGIDHVIVSSTHNHEVPDLMGLWGPSFTKTGVNDEYLKFVKEQIVASIDEAMQALRPTIIKVSTIDSTAKDLVRDSRPPKVFDDTIQLMQFCDAETNKPFGLLMNWGDHPETLGSDNLLITADFCHYWLQGIEKGIEYDGAIKRKGIGGIAVFANGAVGGLMTTLGCNVYDPWLDQHFKQGSFEKARAQGYRLADLVLNQVEHGAWQTLNSAGIGLRANTFLFKVQNKIFMAGGALGLFHRGFVKLKHLRSEVNLLSIGPVQILTIPGEINPEILNGGVEAPEGRDFPIDPVEVPPLRELMTGPCKFVIGLANDEVGYLMPKTHWDTEPPYTYGAEKPMYAEVNSLGPDAGPTVYKQAKALLTATGK